MAVARRRRLPAGREVTVTRSMISKLTSTPRMRRRISRALGKAFFPRDIEIPRTGKYIHFRLGSPRGYAKGGFRTKSIGERGTKAIIACPHGQWDMRRHKCKVGTRIQSVLVPRSRVLRLAKQVYGATKFAVNPTKPKRRYANNPALMTVLNPGFEGNPLDLDYDEKSETYRVLRTNPMEYNDNPYLGVPDFEENPYEDNRRLSYQEKKGFPKSVYGLPGERKYPMPDLAHAKNAKARAKQMLDKGYLTVNQYNRIIRKANAILRRAGIEPGAGFPITQRRRAAANPGAFPWQAPFVPYMGFNNNPEEYCPNPEYCENPYHLHYTENPPYEDHGRHEENPYPFKENPLGKGDYVRATERVMRGDRIMVERGQLGLIEDVGKFWGKKTYRIRFTKDDGSTYIHELFHDQVSSEPYGTNPTRKKASKRKKVRKRKTKRKMRRNPGKGNSVEAMRKQPVTTAYPKQTKVKTKEIPVAKFEAWLKKNGTQDEWNRYQKEIVAYKRFHKGSAPRFITRKIVDVGAGPKVIGRAFGYSMGKSPFEPYITPKGSKKGNQQPYLHEYETMPEGITNASGKMILKPLEGKTKITDWIYH